MPSETVAKEPKLFRPRRRCRAECIIVSCGWQEEAVSPNLLSIVLWQ
jgi:hypothetical protein